MKLQTSINGTLKEYLHLLIGKKFKSASGNIYEINVLPFAFYAISFNDNVLFTSNRADVINDWLYRN